MLEDSMTDNDMSLLDFLGELKHSHQGKPITLDAKLFSHEEEEDDPPPPKSPVLSKSGTNSNPNKKFQIRSIYQPAPIPKPPEQGDSELDLLDFLGDLRNVDLTPPPPSPAPLITPEPETAPKKRLKASEADRSRTVPKTVKERTRKVSMGVREGKEKKRKEEDGEDVRRVEKKVERNEGDRSARKADRAKTESVLPKVYSPEGSDVPLVDYLAQLKEEKGDDSDPEYERTFEDLPEVIKVKCMNLKLNKERMEKHTEVIWRIGQFLYKEEFRNLEKSRYDKHPHEPQVSVEIEEKGRSEVKLPAKPLTKFFKGGKLIGEGGYGKVFQARDCVRKEEVVVKKVLHDTDKNRASNYAEIGFLSQCSHLNIVKFYAAYLHQRKGIEEIWIEFEYLMGGTLSEASKAYQFKDPHIAFITRQISNGVKYLHSRNWAHRDLKSSNVMLQVDGSIKIIDFGLAADMGNGGKTKMLGSAFWIPPEMIIKEQHSLPADIWSLSVCVLEMFYQSPPYAVSPLKCMFEVATVGLQHFIPKGCSEEAKDWLTKALCYDQTKRANILELLKHPWLNQPVPVKELSAILKSVFMSNTIESLM